MIKFHVGKTYAAPSPCDSKCTFSFTILKRSAKSVTIEVRGKRVRRLLKAGDRAEWFRPFGNYSMAATIYADKEAAKKSAP